MFVADENLFRKPTGSQFLKWILDAAREVEQPDAFRRRYGRCNLSEFSLVVYGASPDVTVIDNKGKNAQQVADFSKTVQKWFSQQRSSVNNSHDHSTVLQALLKAGDTEVIQSDLQNATRQIVVLSPEDIVLSISNDFYDSLQTLYKRRRGPAASRIVVLTDYPTTPRLQGRLVPIGRSKKVILTHSYQGAPVDTGCQSQAWPMWRLPQHYRRGIRFGDLKDMDQIRLSNLSMLLGGRVVSLLKSESAALRNFSSCYISRLLSDSVTRYAREVRKVPLTKAYMFTCFRWTETEI